MVTGVNQVGSYAYRPNISSLRANNSVSVSDSVFQGYNNLKNDCVSFSGSSDLTLEQKQKIMKSAIKKATGWSLFGSIFSTAYYGLRSNNTIAKKYGLDPEKDKDFIKQIKNKQTLWTLAGWLPFAGGLIAYLIAANKNSKNIEID